MCYWQLCATHQLCDRAPESSTRLLQRRSHPTWELRFPKGSAAGLLHECPVAGQQTSPQALHPWKLLTKRTRKAVHLAVREHAVTATTTTHPIPQKLLTCAVSLNLMFQETSKHQKKTPDNLGFMIDHFFVKKIMTRMQKEREKSPHTKACGGGSRAAEHNGMGRYRCHTVCFATCPDFPPVTLHTTHPH